MNSIRSFLTGAVVFTSAAGFMQASDPLPGPYFPDGAGIQLKANNFNKKTIDDIHDVGFRVLRKGIYWKDVEKQKGKYDFSDMDAEFEQARKLGVRVVACLFGGNALYGEEKGGVLTEAGRQGFAGFAAAAAAHYKDHQFLWEIWNEPNVRTFWRKDGMHNTKEFAQEYTALVKAAVPAMLKADPNAFVMAGSVSNYWKPSYEWTEFCFQEGILKTGIKGWSVHPYGVKTPEEFAVGHTKTRELLKQYGAPDLPILDTERGFSIKEREEGWSGGSENRALEFQAWNLVRQFMIDRLHNVNLTVWYEWGDKREFGIDDKNLPAHKAARVMLEQLNGYRFVSRLKSDSDLDYVLGFETEKGDRKIVAWTAPPQGGAPDEAQDHQVAVNIQGSNAPLAGVDIQGRPAKSEIKDGELILNLSGAPQYFVVPNGVTLGDVKSLAVAKAAVAASLPPGKDLGLFAPGKSWEFLKNTGEGSFELKQEDGTHIGVLEYDFTKSNAQGTPYVLAASEVDISTQGSAINLRVRSSVPRPLTFRLVDNTGQTLQYKTRIKGTGAWEAVSIPLNRKLENWDGAKDGKVHYPIKKIVFSVPQPSDDAKTGKVEYANLSIN